MAEYTLLEEIERRLLEGDLTRIRVLLTQLSDEERKQLQARLGPDAYARLSRKRARRRAAPQGRVIAIHGIMGSTLYSVDADGREEKVWINPLALLLGGFKRFRLTSGGLPADPAHQVKPGSLLLEYLPLIDALDDGWDVKPFAYDWRVDIDHSATQLNDLIQSWAGGKPCQIVAHSMGGLVSRRFIQLFPETWKSMQDKKSGGRLIMLGTPNRGAMVVPPIFTGDESLVKWLARLDLSHSLNQLLAIINTFGGCYQMLPSPNFVPSDADDRLRLFEAKTWGDLPVAQALLDRGRQFQEELEPVVDPGRMIYIAGYDQETPFRVKVKSPGKFAYQMTSDGDGRVPHELGLLPDVPTYWVREKHGDLQKNGGVLDALHELLRDGTTAILPKERPATRALSTKRAWRNAEDLVSVPPQYAAAAAAMKASGGKRGKPRPGKPLQDEAEKWLAAAALGADIPRTAVLTVAAPAAAKSATDKPVDKSTLAKPAVAKPAGRRPALNLEVVWGDITRAPGQVYCVGHYQGVMPQQAELALDGVVSGVDPFDPANQDRLVLTKLTRRGILRGTLGDVDLYPWAKPGPTQRLVAVAGMGSAGRFGRPQLRQLARSLTAAVGALPNVREVSTVLIGSGAGNLDVADAAQHMALGMSDALAAHEINSLIDTVRIVELDFGRALVIHEALTRLAAGDNEVTQRIELNIRPSIQRGKRGRTASSYGLGIAMATAAELLSSGSKLKRDMEADRLLKAIPAGLRENARSALMKLYEKEIAAEQGRSRGKAAGKIEIDLAKAAKRLQEQSASGYDDKTARLSMLWNGDSLCVTALTNTAVIPERRISVDKTLIDETVTDMIDPPPEERDQLSTVLSGLLIPRDFRDVLRRGEAVVFEVDREMAKVHWEMLTCELIGEKRSQALSLLIPVARQLRTTYSPAPSADETDRTPLKALLIGDPGDGEYQLPGARKEAFEVKKILEGCGVEVTALIGADYPQRKLEQWRPGDEALKGIAPASRRHVLALLMRERFDILHYCGHGSFDPANADRSGWLFEDGKLLSSRELEHVDQVPRLVVANACLSGRVAETRSMGSVNPELALLPSLADEFFRRGVRNYLGTAWEIDDAGAILFAKALYETLLQKRSDQAATLGEAILAARLALYPHEQSFGVLWAAYQHYGDPRFTLARLSR